MALVNELASYVENASFDQLSDDAKRELKIRLLDSLGCAIGALEGAPIRRIKEQIDEFGGAPLVTLIGGGKTSPDRAALYNSALVRYLDYNDSYLAKKETCHPSDNIGSVLAATEYAKGHGRDFLTALGVAYQVQCRLSDVAPVRHKGFDHTVQGSYGAAAGAAKALNLNAEQIANAVSISATAYNALRVTRTGNLSNWKGLAFPSTGWTSTHSAFLAMRGITGPEEVFEGNKGFIDAIAGDFQIHWADENLEKVTDTIIKKYNAEIHSQSTLEGLIEWRNEHNIDPARIRSIELETFDVAYHIIGGGEEGGKKLIRTKEEADHSLPYMMAVAILDGQVLPAQYKTERIEKPDVQELLQKVHVSENPDYSARFPAQEAISVRVILDDGTQFDVAKVDYEGFHTRPASWGFIREKFDSLASPFADTQLRQNIFEVVSSLEDFSISELTQLLAQVRRVAD
ncbi:putative 2-methylcitrate dehydratase [Vibrio nigripulchritudo MADA3029]|uniref:MmgE/PrpD family protein n=1 Tax=Vibrio nigripulchritudo TaxID=28173 RepID=UPI0003B17BFE|nr:MmgE/PrpD family protein [Vibrio nigripulchritudo]CCN46670.1 putative 2-methylcitrate dehydratase [Vibrio nigripulchritudo MADA3020]CCN54553.1 putative 2-methylcitrate dehydratase [Vibrio nigripulchritudo MADA3021]CCN59529.1 putative 2-methylcitrate dehydratase [Vibrio nigripulchritudo MADA3029]